MTVEQSRVEHSRAQLSTAWLVKATNLLARWAKGKNMQDLRVGVEH